MAAVKEDLWAEITRFRFRSDTVEIRVCLVAERIKSPQRPVCEFLYNRNTFEVAMSDQTAERVKTLTPAELHLLFSTLTQVLTSNGCTVKTGPKMPETAPKVEELVKEIPPDGTKT